MEAVIQRLHPVVIRVQVVPFDCSDLLQNYLNPGGCAEQCDDKFKQYYENQMVKKK